MIVPNPVWKQMLICTGGDSGKPEDEVYLPYFKTVEDLKKYNASLHGDIVLLWHCRFCDGYHYFAKPHSPAGESSGNPREYKIPQHILDLAGVKDEATVAAVSQKRGPKRYAVHLSPEVAELARRQGYARRTDSKNRDLEDRELGGWENESEYMESDANARGAEWAAHLYLRMPLGATVGDFKKPDIGKLIQIRSSVVPYHNLIVRPDDNSNHYYILVLGKIPDFVIVGFMSGLEAKQRKYWKPDWETKGPDGKLEPAYLVPQNDLKDVETCPAVMLHRTKKALVWGT